MEPKPNPADFTFNGVLQQPHYDNAVRAWEKMEGMEEAEKAAENYGEDNGEWITNVHQYFTGDGMKQGFEAGVEWKRAHSQKEIDRLNAYIEDLSKGYEH